MTGNILGQFATLCSSDVLDREVLIWLLCHPGVSMGRHVTRDEVLSQSGGLHPFPPFSLHVIPHLLSLPALPLPWPLHPQHATFPDLIRWLSAPIVSQKDHSGGQPASDSSPKTALCLPR